VSAESLADGAVREHRVTRSRELPTQRAVLVTDQNNLLVHEAGMLEHL
jgi:hypothetical protein